MSRSCDSSDVDDKSIFLRSDNKEYFFIFGFEIIIFGTEYKLIDFTFLICDNLIPSAIAIGEKHTFCVSDHYNIIENNKIEEETLIKTTNDNVDPF